MTTSIWIIIILSSIGVLFAVSRLAGGRRSEIIAATAELPATLHPKFDPYGCIATGACIDACPEKDPPIGMVHGKPKLINPSSCVGHGDCMRVCPVQAIDLVIGTKMRGVHVPALSSHFESSQAGLYIAGELGGMGLIHNAVRQGTVAAEAALRTIQKNSDPDVVDLVIVGAGPAGLGAAAQARKLGARYRLLEKRRIGGAIASYPRGKIVMTSPMRFPGLPPITLKRTSKEALVEELSNVIDKLQLSITENCDVTGVRPEADGTFRIFSTVGAIRTQRVIVAVGRRGAPRKIGVPGDDDPRIHYELEDADDFRGKRMIVLGGGDSAIEAAYALSKKAQHVTLIHRGPKFSRAKPDNQRLVDLMRDMDKADVMTDTVVVQLVTAPMTLEVASPAATPLTLVLRGTVGETVLSADAVIACLGADLPTSWLDSMGVAVVTRHGTANRRGATFG
jgi:thioredoxin reductase (NADPH)